MAVDILWRIPLDKAKITIREIALFGMLGALTFGAKVAMSGLPNIEPVSLMVMLFAVVFGWKGLYPVYLYVLMEILLYGINLWNINYLYVKFILLNIGFSIKLYVENIVVCKQKDYQGTILL